MTCHYAVREGLAPRVPSSWGQEKPYFKAGNDLKSRLGALGPPPRQRTVPPGRAQEGARLPQPRPRLLPRRLALPRVCRQCAGGAPEEPAGRQPLPRRRRHRTPPLSLVPGRHPRPASARAPTRGASDWPAAGPGCQRRLWPGWPGVPAAQATPSQPLPLRSRLQAAPGLPLRLQFWQRSPAALQLRAGAPTHPHPCLSAGSLLIRALRCGRCPRRSEARWPEPGHHR